MNPLRASSALFLLIGLSSPSDSQAQVITNLASSIPQFSNVQGTNGWTYGYYNRTGDGNATYSGSEFQPMATSGGGYALGGNPPWTSIGGSTDGHPNGTGSTPNQEHWIIRRFTVPAGQTGNFDAHWLVRKTNGDGGDGVGGMVFHNGTLVDSVIVAATDTTGTVRNATMTGVQPGDTIDLIVSPNAPDNDGFDGSAFYMGINRNTFISIPRTNVIADSVADFGQNTNGWNYGQYTLNAAGDPGGFQNFDASAWSGSHWDANAAPAAPWTEITATGGHPNSNNSDASPIDGEVWATRRYTIQSGEEGSVLVDYNLSKAPFNDGTTVHVLHNGVVVQSTGMDGWDSMGWNGSLLLNVNANDTIDIALSPQGSGDLLGIAGYRKDWSDSSIFGMSIYSVPEPASSGLALTAAVGVMLRRRRATT